MAKIELSLNDTKIIAESLGVSERYVRAVHKNEVETKGKKAQVIIEAIELFLEQRSNVEKLLIQKKLSIF